ncbi:MAG: nucleotide sugar dehydrogenase [Candidatus Saliniplasma sp.]
MLDELKRKLEEREAVVCVVGMGYVGLPLAEYLSEHLKVIGYDIDEEKVRRLNSGDKNELLEFSSDERKIGEADFVIICVPTPVNESKEPELAFVKSATETAGKHMKKGVVVAYESTFYPGVTEEECIPLLEEKSGMVCGEDFFVGYSPERVNPGDKKHTIDKITKVVGGMNEEVGEVLGELYGLITTVHLTKDIKTAEAAKVIENIQRDLNIALMNELSLIFNKMNLDTEEVLEAAATKWNFHRYHPGLVGGHCIPVDPYYLVYKAKRLDYHPQVILAGRAINDGMPKHVGEMAVKGLNRAGKVIKDSKVVIMGLTYKENVEDVRKSPAKDIVKLLKEYDVDVYGYDPYLSDEEIENFGVKPTDNVQDFDCAVITVAHDDFCDIGADYLVEAMNENPVLVDVRGMFKDDDVEGIYLTL